MTDLKVDVDRLERDEARLGTVLADVEAATPAQELRTLEDAVVAIRETFQAVDVELGRRLDAVTEGAP